MRERCALLLSPACRLIKGAATRYKKVPLGVNFIHYDNTQAAQHSLTVLARGAVLHQQTIPIACKGVQGDTQGAWRPLCEALRSVLQSASPCE